MLKIGITGGIGSGKTLVCKVFEQLGVPVFYADDEAKKILDEDDSVITEVKNNFGNEMYSGGKAERKKLSEIVFTDEKKLQVLNSIIHPAVFRKFDEWCGKQNSKYILKEAAILFESAADKGLDYVIAVSAPDELRIQRVMKRDNVLKEKVLSVMKRQMSEVSRIKRASFMINNNDNELVIPQVMKLHQKFSGK